MVDVLTEAKDLARMTGQSAPVTIDGEIHHVRPIKIKDLPTIMIKVVPALQELARSFPSLDLAEVDGNKLAELFASSTKVLELVVFILEAVTGIPATKLLDGSAADVVNLANVVIDQNYNLVSSLKKTANLVKGKA